MFGEDGLRGGTTGGWHGLGEGEAAQGHPDGGHRGRGWRSGQP